MENTEGRKAGRETMDKEFERADWKLDWLRGAWEQSRERNGAVHIPVEAEISAELDWILEEFLDYSPDPLVWRIDADAQRRLPSKAQALRADVLRLLDQVTQLRDEHGWRITLPQLSRADPKRLHAEEWAHQAADLMLETDPVPVCVIVHHHDRADQYMEEFLDELRDSLETHRVVIVTTEVTQRAEDDPELEADWSQLSQSQREILAAAAMLAQLGQDGLVWDAELLRSTVHAAETLGSDAAVRELAKRLAENAVLDPEELELQDPWARSLNSGEPGTQSLLSFPSRAVRDFVLGSFDEDFLEQIKAGVIAAVRDRLTEFDRKAARDDYDPQDETTSMGHSAGQLLARQAITLHQQGQLETDEQALACLLKEVVGGIDRHGEVMDVEAQHELAGYGLENLPNVSAGHLNGLRYQYARALDQLGEREASIKLLNDWQLQLEQDAGVSDKDRIGALREVATRQWEAENFDEAIATILEDIPLESISYGVESEEATEAWMVLGRTLMLAGKNAVKKDEKEAGGVYLRLAETVLNLAYRQAVRFLPKGTDTEAISALELVHLRIKRGDHDGARQILRELMPRLAVNMENMEGYQADAMWTGVKHAAVLKDYETILRYGPMVRDYWEKWQQGSEKDRKYLADMLPWAEQGLGTEQAEELLDLDKLIEQWREEL